MNIFDIIGPIMIGPSSSHTDGAVKIGRIARELLGEEPKKVLVQFHGSFAETYRGHGTDKAIIAGLMGMMPDDLRIRDSLSLADHMKWSYSFETVNLKNVHPNTVLIEATGATGKSVKVTGSSIGGGNIVMKRLNGLEVEFTGDYNTLVVFHKDTQGTIAMVTSLIGQEGINIAQMKMYRMHRGGGAIMVIETDQRFSEDLLFTITELPNVTDVRKIRRM